MGLPKNGTITANSEIAMHLLVDIHTESALVIQLQWRDNERGTTNSQQVCGSA